MALGEQLSGVNFIIESLWSNSKSPNEHEQQDFGFYSESRTKINKTTLETTLMKLCHGKLTQEV